MADRPVDVAPLRQPGIALGVDASGDLVLAGRWTNTSATTSPNQFQIVRYAPAGLLDAGFGNQGVSDLSQWATYGIQSVGFHPDGHIILGIPCYNGLGTGGVARLNTDGALDTTFGTGGFFADPAVTGTGVSAVQPDGKVLLYFYDSHSAAVIWSTGSSPAVPSTPRSAPAANPSTPSRESRASAGLKRSSSGPTGRSRARGIPRAIPSAPQPSGC
jgi:hypothetical protein